MAATRMLDGRWRIILGHRNRTYLYFNTRAEASRAILREQEKAKERDSIRGKAEKPIPQKPKS